MNSDTRDSLRTEDERIYRLRRKNFQRNLVTRMGFMGYVVLVLYYLKYGCSIWNLLLRVCVQSLLTVPFPSEIQIQRLTQARENGGSAYFSTISRTTPAETVAMPGAFPSGSESQVASRSEIQIKQECMEIKRKIRQVLFHCSLTVNVLFVVLAILFPVNFTGKLQGHYLNEEGLINTPSPFSNGNGVVHGERKGGFSMQMIGEALPPTNFKGNIGILAFEFIILFCQYGLFVLTCINFADLDDRTATESDPTEVAVSDGYDGKVSVTQIDPISAIHDVMFPMIDTGQPSPTMV